MGIGSIAMWLVVPVLWIYIASQMVETSQPSLGPYVLILVAVPLSMVIIGKALSALNRVYARSTGTDAHVRVQMPWHKSMRGERETNRPRTVLDVVMVVSVSLALLLFGIWFFFFAGSSLPNV
jgi:hypothetical protein